MQVSADGIEGITFPLLMAIIHVDKGKVTGINWDSTCSWCDPDQCSQSVHDFGGDVVADGGNCFVKDSACLSDVGTTRLCELNVNIVWTGTDSEERYFLSSTPRFSRLTAEQITDYTDRLDGESKLVDFLPSGQPTSAPTNPTGEPTSIPTSPTGMPTRAPTKAPSVAPSPSFPTGEPTSMPSEEQAVNASTIL